jgi:gamma-glutamyltranspeptidase/glutathione hydrolase
MLSSMTPTIVTRDGKVVLLTGTPGGRTIINTVFTIVLGVTEFGLNGRDAVDLARMHHQWLPDRVTFEEDPPSPEGFGGAGVSANVLEKLRAMGHEVRSQGRQGDAHSIWIGPDGVPYGVNDKRTADSKVSVPANLTLTTAGR